MTTWLLIGSSPSVLRTLLAAWDMHPRAKTITTNGGIELWPRPDVYFLTDQHACLTYRDLAREAQRHGTHCVTLRRLDRALKARGIEWFDEFLELPPCGDIVRERWSPFRYSGPVCLEYALRAGATEIALVGCDGYTGRDDYWDGRENTKSKDPYQQGTIAVLQPMFRRLATLWPEVKFVRYGRPVFQVGTPNWKDVEC